MGSENGPILDPIKIMVILDSDPETALLHCKIKNSDMGKNWEILLPGPQDGARLGSRANFYRVQVEVQKEVMLGPWKLDVGDLKSANKGSILGSTLGVQNGDHFKSNSS